MGCMFCKETAVEDSDQPAALISCKVCCVMKHRSIQAVVEVTDSLPFMTHCGLMRLEARKFLEGR